MTEDTARALEIIKPIAKEFGINVKADDKFLYCDGQAIGIGANSTYATLCEFVGYLMMWLSIHEYRYKVSFEKLEKAITRYWFSEDQIKKI